MKQLLLILAGVCTITACSHKDGKQVNVQTVNVDTVKVAGEQTKLQYPGKVKASEDISLAFKVSGTVEKLFVKEGTTVRKGQLLARLDQTDYRVQLNATEAEYKQVKAEVERVIALYKENGTTPNSYDKAVYGLQQITAKYEHHKDELEYTCLFAPFDGVVQKCLFKEHETIGAGMPVISFVSTKAPEVEINLPATEAVRRGLFQSYECTFDVFPGEVYPLRFLSITPKANANQLYQVRLLIEAGERKLPSPGMNTMVTVYCNAGDATLMSIPNGSLLQEDGKVYVYIYRQETKTVKKTEIKLHQLLSDGRCLVSSGQLRDGDLIVASGVHFIKDGERVETLPAVTSSNVGGLL